MKNYILLSGVLLGLLINISCRKKDDNPSPQGVISVASSTYTKNGLTVTFTNTSTNTPVSYSWNFGDGTALSTDEDPIHSYAAAGTYTVVLTVTNTGGSTTQTQTITVAALQPAIASSTFTKNGLTVTFSNTSTNNPTSYSWNFGDASAASTETNPVHTYSSAGTYTVTLTATNSDGSSTQTQSITVAELQPAIASSTFTKQGLIVTFNNTSTNNPTSYSWDFGDATAASTEMNPVHTYAAAGTYTVTLTATNSDGSSTQTQSIIVKQLNVRILAVTLRSIAFYSGGPLETDGSNPDYFFTTTGAVVYTSAVANEVSALPYTWTLPTPLEITANKFSTGLFLHTKEYDSASSSESLFSEGYAFSTYPTYPSKIRLNNSTQATELTVEWYE